MQNLSKKVGILAASAVVAFAIAACGSSPSQTSAETSVVTTTVTETETSMKTTSATTESATESRTTRSSKSSSSVSRPTEEVVSHDGNWLFCDDGHSAAFATTTSCGFAKAVRKEFEKDPRNTVVAKSPVTKQTYEMKCSSMGDTEVIWLEQKFEAARCEGGNNAVVYIY